MYYFRWRHQSEKLSLGRHPKQHMRRYSWSQVEEADALVMNNAEPTFYAVNGKSVIDLTIITENLLTVLHTKHWHRNWTTNWVPQQGTRSCLQCLQNSKFVPKTHPNDIRLGKHWLEGVENYIGWKDDPVGQSGSYHIQRRPHCMVQNQGHSSRSNPRTHSEEGYYKT